jgi:FlgD Ig-like domain
MSDTKQSKAPNRAPGRGVLVLLICFLGAGFLSAAAGSTERLAAEKPTVSFVPLIQYVHPNDLCTLQVVVDDAVDSLSCMEVYIAYDATYVECTAALEGRLFDQSPYPTFFSWQAVASDTVMAVDCVLGNRKGFRSPGELVKFVFRAKALGICWVSFTALQVWDINRAALDPVPGVPAEIVVSNSSGDGSEMPRGSSFLFNYPNPFNPSTTLVLWLPGRDANPSRQSASVKVYSPGGVEIRTLFEGALSSGRSEFRWDGRDDRGRAVAAGVYFAAARSSRGVSRRTLVLVR